MEAVDVIVTGSLCLDLIPRMAHVPLDELATPGRLFEVGELDISTGGAVSNTGLALHRLGVNVRLMASVGDDLLGRVIIAFLKDRDPVLADLITVRPNQASSYTVVLTPGKVDRLFLHCLGVNKVFDVGNVDYALLTQAKLLHLGYPTVLSRLLARGGERLALLFQQAKATGVVTSLDTAVPDPQGSSGRVNWGEVLARALPQVDIYVPSIEEILFMLRRADFDAWRGDIPAHLTADYLADFADEMLDMGSAIVGFKLGEMGLYLHMADESRLAQLERLPIDPATWANARQYAPTFQVDVVGTTGAGDSSYAGLLAALLRGMDPPDAARWACAVGACNVEAADATSGVRTWDETQARMDAGWPHHPMRLAGFD